MFPFYGRHYNTYRDVTDSGLVNAGTVVRCLRWQSQCMVVELQKAGQAFAASHKVQTMARKSRALILPRYITTRETEVDHKMAYEWHAKTLPITTHRV